jgi:hypothetical protein
LSVVFWLSTFASIAVLATGYSIIDAYAYTYYKRGTIQARFVDIAGCYKGAAALGAIEWALFIGTLITYGM